MKEASGDDGTLNGVTRPTGRASETESKIKYQNPILRLRGVYLKLVNLIINLEKIILGCNQRAPTLEPTARLLKSDLRTETQQCVICSQSTFLPLLQTSYLR